MSKLKGKNSSMAIRRPTAEILLKVEGSSKQHSAVGHLDEVNELRKGGTKITGEEGSGIEGINCGFAGPHDFLCS